MGSVKTTLRKKEKINRKTKESYFELVGIVDNGSNEKIGVSIPCDEDGNVKTYTSDKYDNDFVYATVFKFKPNDRKKKSTRSL